jgi:hypothetical protein
VKDEPRGQIDVVAERIGADRHRSSAACVHEHVPGQAARRRHYKDRSRHAPRIATGSATETNSDTLATDKHRQISHR